MVECEKDKFSICNQITTVILHNLLSGEDGTSKLGEFTMEITQQAGGLMCDCGVHSRCVQYRYYLCVRYTYMVDRQAAWSHQCSWKRSHLVISAY
jgi:hypothetical protein